jgi:hypothetical protein
MTTAQYRSALAQLGVTPTAAGRLLCVDERTSRRYSSRGVSGAPEILLKLLLTQDQRGRCELCNPLPVNLTAARIGLLPSVGNCETR